MLNNRSQKLWSWVIVFTFVIADTFTILSSPTIVHAGPNGFGTVDVKDQKNPIIKKVHVVLNGLTTDYEQGMEARKKSGKSRREMDRRDPQIDARLRTASPEQKERILKEAVQSGRFHYYRALKEARMAGVMTEIRGVASSRELQGDERAELLAQYAKAIPDYIRGMSDRVRAQMVDRYREQLQEFSMTEAEFKALPTDRQKEIGEKLAKLQESAQEDMATVETFWGLEGHFMPHGYMHAIMQGVNKGLLNEYPKQLAAQAAGFMEKRKAALKFAASLQKEIDALKGKPSSKAKIDSLTERKERIEKEAEKYKSHALALVGANPEVSDAIIAGSETNLATPITGDSYTDWLIRSLETGYFDKYAIGTAGFELRNRAKRLRNADVGGHYARTSSGDEASDPSRVDPIDLKDLIDPVTQQMRANPNTGLPDVERFVNLFGREKKEVDDRTRLATQLVLVPTRRETMRALRGMRGDSAADEVYQSARREGLLAAALQESAHIQNLEARIVDGDPVRATPLVSFEGRTIGTRVDSRRDEIDAIDGINISHEFNFRDQKPAIVKYLELNPDDVAAQAELVDTFESLFNIYMLNNTPDSNGSELLEKKLRNRKKALIDAHTKWADDEKIKAIEEEHSLGLGHPLYKILDDNSKYREKRTAEINERLKSNPKYLEKVGARLRLKQKAGESNEDFIGRVVAQERKINNNALLSIIGQMKKSKSLPVDKLVKVLRAQITAYRGDDPDERLEMLRSGNCQEDPDRYVACKKAQLALQMAANMGLIEVNYTGKDAEEHNRKHAEDTKMLRSITSLNGRQGDTLRHFISGKLYCGREKEFGQSELILSDLNSCNGDNHFVGSLEDAAVSMNTGFVPDVIDAEGSRFFEIYKAARGALGTQVRHGEKWWAKRVVGGETLYDIPKAPGENATFEEKQAYKRKVESIQSKNSKDKDYAQRSYLEYYRKFLMNKAYEQALSMAMLSGGATPESLPKGCSKPELEGPSRFDDDKYVANIDPKDLKEVYEYNRFNQHHAMKEAHAQSRTDFAANMEKGQFPKGHEVFGGMTRDEAVLENAATAIADAYFLSASDDGTGAFEDEEDATDEPRSQQYWAAEGRHPYLFYGAKAGIIRDKKLTRGFDHIAALSEDHFGRDARFAAGTGESMLHSGKRDSKGFATYVQKVDGKAAPHPFIKKTKGGQKALGAWSALEMKVDKEAIKAKLKSDPEYRKKMLGALDGYYAHAAKESAKSFQKLCDAVLRKGDISTAAAKFKDAPLIIENLRSPTLVDAALSTEEGIQYAFHECDLRENHHRIFPNLPWYAEIPAHLYLWTFGLSHGGPALSIAWGVGSAYEDYAVESEEAGRIEDIMKKAGINTRKDLIEAVGREDAARIQIYVAAASEVVFAGSAWALRRLAKSVSALKTMKELELRAAAQGWKPSMRRAYAEANKRYLHNRKKFLEGMIDYHKIYRHTDAGKRAISAARKELGEIVAKQDATRKVARQLLTKRTVPTVIRGADSHAVDAVRVAAHSVQSGTIDGVAQFKPMMTMTMDGSSVELGFTREFLGGRESKKYVKKLDELIAGAEKRIFENDGEKEFVLDTLRNIRQQVEKARYKYQQFNTVVKGKVIGSDWAKTFDDMAPEAKDALFDVYTKGDHHERMVAEYGEDFMKAFDALAHDSDGMKIMSALTLRVNAARNSNELFDIAKAIRNAVKQCQREAKKA